MWINVIVPIGGGGLIAGIATAIKSINPTIKIIGVQSQNVHGMAASYYAGEITNHRTCTTLADGCDVARPGSLTFEIVRELVDDIVLVTEDEIRDSMIALIQRNKVVTEGAGALASAALLSGKLDHYIQGRKTVSIISGGQYRPVACFRNYRIRWRLINSSLVYFRQLLDARLPVIQK
ncbi:L-threonine dehydratase catabolic TdcB [Kluyvera cryocrescens]|uniref:L-threonine dehydratase catabolic TdcB n=1 Tax=Kluyvera cryocrescens TaxID=580 RepID=A0A485AKD6_KLUCR|nr:L-threonine dehydratase catabolic TdcB [Kluyvera cryocrescens]